MKKLFFILAFITASQLQAQNVGIGTVTPNYPLSFPNTIGDKIALFGNSGAHYGFGIQGGLLQIHSAGTGDDIAFGYGSSSAFTESMRIKGNGNVGIGILLPNAKLDVLGQVNLRGTYYSSHFNLSTNEDTYIRGGKIDSRVFINDFLGAGNTIIGSNLGIGTTSPGFPLNFPDALGDKISLSGNSGAHYGFGIQGSLLQIHSAGTGDDIAFGYGSSAAFTERMRVKGNGNVGIGTSTPQIAGLVVDKKVGATNAVFGSNTPGVAIESTFPGIGFNTYDDDFSRKTIATGFGGYIGVSPNSGEMIFSVTNASFAAQTNVSSNLGLSISSNGNTGVGVTADPNYKMDIGGRMRIRSGGDLNNSAGIWLNNTTNTTVPAFIGMQNNEQVGFYGTGSAWGFVMNTTTGNVGLGTTTPTAKMEVNGFSKLGSDAPAIKVLKLIGTTPNIEGGEFIVSIGIPSSKILAVSVLVEDSPGAFTPPSFRIIAGYEYNFNINSNGSYFRLSTQSLNSANILSKPYRVMITYEE